MLQLGVANGIAVIGRMHGRILIGDGQREDGLEVLRRSAAAFRQLGQDTDAARIDTMIHQIEAIGGT